MVRGGIGGSLNDNENHNNEQEQGGSHGWSTEQHLLRPLTRNAAGACAVYQLLHVQPRLADQTTRRGVRRHLDREDMALFAKDGWGRPVRLGRNLGAAAATFATGVGGCC